MKDVKLTYIKLNSQTTCPPRAAVQVNSRMYLSPFLIPFSHRMLVDNAGYTSNWYSVGGHGNSVTIKDEWNNDMYPEDLAKRIKFDPKYHGQPIILNICSVGAGKDSFAEKLSKILNTLVFAPDNFLQRTQGSKNFLLGKHDVESEVLGGGGYVHFGLIR